MIRRNFRSHWTRGAARKQIHSRELEISEKESHVREFGPMLLGPPLVFAGHIHEWTRATCRNRFARLLRTTRENRRSERGTLLNFSTRARKGFSHVWLLNFSKRDVISRRNKVIELINGPSNARKHFSTHSDQKFASLAKRRRYISNLFNSVATMSLYIGNLFM